MAGKAESPPQKSSKKNETLTEAFVSTFQSQVEGAISENRVRRFACSAKTNRDLAFCPLSKEELPPVVSNRWQLLIISMIGFISMERLNRAPVNDFSSNSPD